MVDVNEPEEEMHQVREMPLADLSLNEEGEKVINFVITVKEKLGTGAFSSVHRVLYKFEWQDDDGTN